LKVSTVPITRTGITEADSAYVIWNQFKISIATGAVTVVLRARQWPTGTFNWN